MKPRRWDRTTCSEVLPTRPPSCCRRSSHGCRPSGLRREYDAIGFFLSGHPLDDYATALKRLRVQSWAEFSRAVKRRVRPRARSPRPWCRGWSGAPRPANKIGHHRAVPTRPAISRRCLVFGRPGAIPRHPRARAGRAAAARCRSLQGEDVRARVLHAEPLDAAAAKTQKGLRIFLRDTKPLDVDRAAAADAGSGAAGRTRARIAGEVAVRGGQRRRRRYLWC